MSGPDKKSKHLLRLNRIGGQVEAIQRALEGDARVRPFFSRPPRAVMTGRFIGEITEDHVRERLVREKERERTPRRRRS